MKRILAILGALITLSVFPIMFSMPAEAQPVCGTHGSVVDNLKKGYSETPASMGVTNGGAVIEVFTSEEGTWTLVITQPNGLSCLIASGENWESLPKLIKGSKI